MANNVTLSYPSAFHHQFLDLNGKPLTGGKLYTYSAGTPTPVPTYKTIGDTSSTNTNTNPIILDNAGMAYIVIETDKAYKFVLFDKNDAKIAEWDNVTGNIGGGGGSSEDIVVVGTPNEIDVSGSVTQGVKRYVISLSNSVKSTILYLVGLYTNVLNSLGNKADKVQGATAGNLAALDANGNLTDSGSKVADFKTKQTPVADPSASGAGLEFIDSVSQDANGEITPHKKSVQDGTTAQKGIVKLSNAIDSTSVTEAATPKAVKDAYDELNNKIVARAVFLSQAEWAVQSQLPGDPAKVYYVENGTGEDAYTVYVWKESTSTYEEVDESSIDLDGYWHDSPTTTGNGNVVTNITLGNDGVPQVEKGMSAEPAFSVLPVNKGGTGADTIKGALSTLTSETQHYDTLPTDDTLIVHKFGTANASNGALYTRKLSYLWTYIQNKISSVLGLTANNYDGKAATAVNNEDSVKLIRGMYAMESKSYTIPDLIDEIRVLHGARCGSVRIDSTYTKDNVTIGIGWYNFEYLPHRGNATGDSANYGTLLLSGITVTKTFYVLCYSNGNVDHLWQLTNTEGSYPNMSVGNAATASAAASGSALESAINAKQDKISDLATIRSGATAGASALQPSGNGSNLSVTPDGTSTGTDIGNSTTLKAFAQKFKNLVSVLKALAFKDKVSDSDINGTISDSHIASASTWNGKQDSLGINASSGDTGKFLNERGAFATPNYPSVPSVINNLTSDSTTDALSAAQGKALNNNIYNRGNAAMTSSAGKYAKLVSLTISTTAYDESSADFDIYANAAPYGTAAFVGKLCVQVRINSDNTLSPNAKLFVIGQSITPTLHVYFSDASHMLIYAEYTDFEYSVSCKLCYFTKRDGSVLTESTATYYTNTHESSVNYGLEAQIASTRYAAIPIYGGVGSTTTPVYVDSNGQVQSCDVLSGGTSNFNRTFTTTYTVGSTDQYITTLIKNDNTDLIADYVTWHNAHVGKLSSPPMIIITLSARTAISNTGLITLNMYKNGNGCDVFGEKYAYMSNQHDSKAYNTQYFTDQTFVSGSAYYLNIRNETQNTMWAAGTILDISIRIVAHAVSVT